MPFLERCPIYSYNRLHCAAGVEERVKDKVCTAATWLCAI